MVISVVVPTCDRPDLLALCLEALSPRIQTIDSELYEVIVTDDGKDEKTKELVETKYNWAKWVEGPHKGPAANRNNGVLNSTGNWIAFIDDDCIPEANWLRCFLDSLISNTNVRVLEGKTICKKGINSPMETAPVNTTGGFLWSCNMAIQKDLFIQLKGFNTAFPFPHMEDVDFREKIQNMGETILFVDGAIVDHPPRRMKFGKNLAKLHESSYYYWKVIKGSKKITFVLLKDILRFRIKAIINHQLSKDTFFAICSLVEEFAFTIIYLKNWKKKY